MITGVRLTQLAHGEPLIGASWSYKNLYGVSAVEQRLEDLFNAAQYLGFNFIIDTITPQLTSQGLLTLDNNGIYGDQWSIERRLELYKTYSFQTGIQLLIEVDFPGDINSNIDYYAQYFIELVTQYPWVGYWQVMLNPETLLSNGQYKCTPANYVKFLNIVYSQIKINYPGIKIGGPGIYDGLIEYVNSEYISPSGITLHNGWLAEAMGEKYGSDPSYQTIGPLGFLNNIDFFSIQGEQNTYDLRYEIFPSVISKLNNGIEALFSNQRLTKTIQIFSISQGHQALSGDNAALEEQPFYDLREILNCVDNNIVSFKTQLVDEYFDPSIYGATYDATKAGFGLLYYYLGASGYKPACTEYNFLLKNLKNYNVSISNTITSTNQVYEANPDVNSITLISNDQSSKVTIIWPTTFRPLSPVSSNLYTNVVLTPHYYRQYLLPTGQQLSVVDSTEISFENYDFILVFETIVVQVVDKAAISSAIQTQLTYTEEILVDLINLLPSSYNKEVRDVNYYKLLRSLAFEMANADIQVDIVKDDTYLKTAHGTSIYNNFGVLVNLQQQPQWNDEQYRLLVQGVTKSLLEGPTKQSIIDALQLFTNFKVNIFELYKDAKYVDPGMYTGMNPQFTFVVEIEKPIEDSIDQASVYSDTMYILSIVKPAHTIGVIIVLLAGTENYRDQYASNNGVLLDNADISRMDLEEKAVESIFGWRYGNYPGQFSTMDTNIISNSSLTNGGLLLGPRYVLYDNVFCSCDFSDKNDIYPKQNLEETMLSLLNILGNEQYHDVLDSSLVNFDYNFKEAKYGIVDDGLIKTNGGLLYNQNEIIGNEFRVLNLFRLAVHNRVMDELDSFLFEYIENEDISLRSRFELHNPYPSGVIDVAISGFSDQLATIGIDSNPDIYLIAEPHEYYRNRTLGPINYHIHKQITETAQAGENTIFLPETDLFLKGSATVEYTTKIYINGFLMPTWAYNEVANSFDPTRSNVIVLENDIIQEGDIIVVTYLCDRNIIVDNFSIVESSISALSYNINENVNWNYTSNVMNGLILNINPLNLSPFISTIQERVNFKLFRVNQDGTTTVLANSGIA